MFDVHSLKQNFIARYGEGREIWCFFAPGRINLIGEHIDYNGGMVLPAALSMGTYGLLRHRGDSQIHLGSMDQKGAVVVDLDLEISRQKENIWANYPLGVIHYLRQDHRLRGCEVLYASTVPHSAGLSSSAALEMVTAYMMLYPFEDRVYLAKLCQTAENQFVGVNCGIMDQFVVGLGKKNHALLLDSSTLMYQYIPLYLKEYTLVIINTNKKRELADSKYNERREECQICTNLLRKRYTIDYLCQANLQQVYDCIEDVEIVKRARHVVTEQERVQNSVEALKQGDMIRFGQYMTASHVSLRDDYEVTGRELDVVVKACLQVDGCIGARMTGAGFGGCAIALVNSDRISEFRAKVASVYRLQTGIDADFYPTNIEDGVRLVYSPDNW